MVDKLNGIEAKFKEGGVVMTVNEMKELVAIIDAMENWVCCSSPDYKNMERNRNKRRI